MTGNARGQHLPRYNGRLSPAEIAEGVTVAGRNAARLAADAEIMLDHERFPTAASLATLAIEEVGKIMILRALSLARSDREARRSWRRFRSHRAKNGMWILPKLAAEGMTTLSEVASVIDPESEESAMLDAIKQVGFYSDCVAERHWVDPAACIDRELANSLVRIASALAEPQKFSTRELELWVEILSPHVGRSTQVDAAIRYHQALVGEGLTEDVDDGFATFLAGCAEGDQNQ